MHIKKAPTSLLNDTGAHGALNLFCPALELYSLVMCVMLTEAIVISNGPSGFKLIASKVFVTPHLHFISTFPSWRLALASKALQLLHLLSVNFW
jgi:hypothetical protein